MDSEKEKPVQVKPFVMEISEDEYYEKLAELDQMQRLHDQGLEFC